MFDPERLTERVELVRACCRALSQAKQPVGEFLAVVGKYGADAQRAGMLQVAQEAAGVGSSIGLEDADEDPASRTIDGDKQIPA